MQEEANIPKDKLGREIKVGCYVAYPYAIRDIGTIRIGQVLAIEVRTFGGYELNEPGFRFTVKGVNDTKSPRGTEDWRPTKKKFVSFRSRYIGFGDRMIILQREDIPQKYLDIMDKSVPDIPSQED